MATLRESECKNEGSRSTPSPALTLAVTRYVHPHGGAKQIYLIYEREGGVGDCIPTPPHAAYHNNPT